MKRYDDDDDCTENDNYDHIECSFAWSLVHTEHHHYKETRCLSTGSVAAILESARPQKGELGFFQLPSNYQNSLLQELCNQLKGDPSLFHSLSLCHFQQS